MKPSQLFQALIAMLIATAHQPTFAGGSGTGNGGDAVVCRDQAGTIISAELLDFYEARILRDTKVDLGPESVDYTAMIETLLTRLTQRSPNRGKVYAEWYKTFESESLFLSGVELTDIPDSLHAAMPKGCKVEQVAIQEPPAHTEDKRYLVSKDIWSQLPNSSKAGLILHELFYREAIETHTRYYVKDPLNSIDVRYFNAIVASNKIATITLKDWNELIQASFFFQFIEIDGLNDLVRSEKSGDRLKLKYSENGQSIIQWSNCCSFKLELDTFSKRTQLQYFDFVVDKYTLNNGLVLRNENGARSASFDQDYYLFSYVKNDQNLIELPYYGNSKINYANKIIQSAGGDLEIQVSRNNEFIGAFSYFVPSPQLAPRCQSWTLNPNFEIVASMTFSGKKNRLDKITVTSALNTTVCGITFPKVTRQSSPLVLNFDDRGGLAGDSPMPYFSASTFDLSEASINSRYAATANTVISLLGEKIPAKTGTELSRDNSKGTFAFTTDKTFSICNNEKCKRGCTQYLSGSVVSISDDREGVVCWK